MERKGNTGEGRKVSGTSTKKSVKRTRKVTEGYKGKVAHTQEVEDRSTHPGKKKVHKK